jgi:hypothetical protein
MGSKYSYVGKKPGLQILLANVSICKYHLKNAVPAITTGTVSAQKWGTVSLTIF